MKVNQMCTDGWMDKQNVVMQKIEYYLALKRNLTNATTKMNVENIMVSKVNQSQKGQIL